MIGYFNNKKVTTGYLGNTVIYKEEVEEPLFIMGSEFVSSNSRVLIMVTRKEGGTKRAVAGEPFYEGDSLRVVLTDWAYKFRSAPTYRPEGSTGNTLAFETKLTDQEYSTKFPQGYSGGLSYSTVKV